MKNNFQTLKFVVALGSFAGITLSAIVCKCEIYRIMPLYISLFVMYLQMYASRISFLIGGCNAVFYAVVYFYLKLYGMAIYSLLIACPIQIITYLRWKKRSYKHSAVLKRLSVKSRMVWIFIFSVAWVALYGLLKSFGSEYIILDNTAAVIGVAANFASLMYLIEFPYIQSVSHIINIILNGQMIVSDPKQWTFLIYYLYALFCAVLSAVYMQKLYNNQISERKS